MCVCPQGGEGVCLSACWDAIPPPPDQADPPPGPGRPPQTRETPPDQGDPPQTRETPLGPGRPPRTRRTPRDQADVPPMTRKTPPGSRLQHTVYERPVRILLECILVLEMQTDSKLATLVTLTSLLETNTVICIKIIDTDVKVNLLLVASRTHCIFYLSRSKQYHRYECYRSS